MSLKVILKLVLSWRLLTVLIALPAMFLLVPRTRFTNITLTPSVSNIFTMWSNFDGVRYLNLAEFGYGSLHRLEADFAFFPGYPLAISSLNFLRNYLATGLLISHLSLILGLYFLFKLISLDFKLKIARSTIYFILIFPTAFFFGSIYPDSLLFLLTILSFYFARRKSFLLASLIATLASATGIIGLFLWPCIVYEFWLASGKNFKNSLRPSLIWLGLPPLGIFLFLRFQTIKSALSYFPAFLNSAFNGQTVDKFILIHQVFFRYFMMIIYTDHWDPLFFTIILELFCAFVILLVLIFSFKKIRFSYWLFTLLAFIMPAFSGSFMGLPRSTLILFPVFIYLALWLERQHPFIRLIYYLLCTVGSIYCLVLFTRGYFVG